MNGWFITGTDTMVGKTLTSSVITQALNGCYWKPIQSGDSDFEQVKSWTNLSEDHYLSPQYALKASLSPDQAAKLENISIDLETLALPTTQKSVIVEGAGGIFAPINERHFILDVIKKFNLPVVIVARGGLGTINHTLLTIAVLRQHHVDIHGIVYNGDLNPDNQQAIESKSGIKTLFHLPKFEKLEKNTIQNWVKDNITKLQENFA